MKRSDAKMLMRVRVTKEGGALRVGATGWISQMQKDQALIFLTGQQGAAWMDYSKIEPRKTRKLPKSPYTIRRRKS